MALSDPFSTTYEGSFKAGQSLGQGIDSAAGSIAGAMEQKSKQAQAQKMLQTIGFGKQTGAIKTEETPLTPEEYNQQAEQALAKVGPQLFKSNTTLTGSSDPKERMQQYQKLFQAAGIPGPKSTKTTTTVDAEKMDNAQKFGYTYNPSTGEMTVHSTEIDPATQAMKEQNQEMAKERLQDLEDSRTFNQAQVITKDVDPSNAPRGSVVGMIAQRQLKADSALGLLDQPVVTGQMAAGIAGDYASIIQNGSPTQLGMSEQEYGSAQQKAASIAQWATAHPQDALPQEFKDILKSSFNDLKQTGAKTLNQHMDIMESTHKEWIKKHPDQWKEIRDKVSQDYSIDGDNSSNGAKSLLNTAGMGGKPQQKSKYTLVQ